jgi:F0F1-type ATP synthase membrane subunit b/b'
MAALNLVPNPPVLVVQAGIFLANLAIIKKLYVDPYLSVRDRRDAQTLGNKDAATAALSQAEAVQAKISESLSAAADAAKKARDAQRATAIEKRNAVLKAAEAEAQAQVAAVEKQIQAELQSEKAKVPGIVASLTQEVYQLALQ